MPTRRSSQRRSRSGPRAKYQWIQRQNATETLITAGNAAVVDLLSGFENKPVWMTVVRLILQLSVRSNTAGQIIQWAHGVLLVTLDAFNAAAIPEPETDHQKWYLNDGGIYQTDADAGSVYSKQSYDIRSARAIRAIDTILCHAIDNVGASTALQYQVVTNALVRLG